MGIQAHCLVGLYTFVLQSHEVCWHQSKNEIINFKGLKIQKIELTSMFLKQKLRNSNLYLLKTENKDMPLLFPHEEVSMPLTNFNWF